MNSLQPRSILSADIFTLTGVSVEFAQKKILCDLNLSIGAGEVFGVIGPNGAGKSTLLKLLAGLNFPSSGEMYFHGKFIQTYSVERLATMRSYLEQDNHSAWSLTVHELVALGRVPHLGAWERMTEKDMAAIETAMNFTDVTQFSHRSIYSLSGGERARVFLARALATEAQVLISDEPIAALDVHHQIDILRLFRHLAAKGQTVVVSLHDLNFALRSCDRIAILSEGRLLSVATPAELIRSPLFETVFKNRFSWGMVGEDWLLSPEF